MIERLRESSGGVIGFRVVGKMTAEDIKEFEPQLEVLIRERKHKPIGILADLSAMHGAELKGALGGVALPAKAYRPHCAHGRRRRRQVGRDHGDADRRRIGSAG